MGNYETVNTIRVGTAVKSDLITENNGAPSTSNNHLLQSPNGNSIENTYEAAPLRQRIDSNDIDSSVNYEDTYVSNHQNIHNNKPSKQSPADNPGIKSLSQRDQENQIQSEEVETPLISQ